MWTTRKREAREPRPDWIVEDDFLGQFTDHLRLVPEFSSIVRVTPPFTTIVTRESLHIFLATHGQVYVTFEGRSDPTVLLKTGEVLVLAGAVPFRLHYPLDVPSVLNAWPVQDGWSAEPGPNDVELLGMLCYLDGPYKEFLADFFPPAIHLKKGTGNLEGWVEPTVALIRAEYQTRSPGRRSVLSRVAEIVCVQALRGWVAQMPRETKGWLQGLKDERIALALQAIHKDPGYAWTVELLGERAAMSRTVFATRFKALVGESPMEYLCRWRMHCAAMLLRQGTASVKSVSEAMGYKSASTFRTNFKRRFGVLPARYRKA